jgi:hypothetical protein
VPGEAPSGASLWLAGVAALGILAARRWGARRTLAVGIGLGLAVFAVESTIHAVHHLTSSQEAERCPVFSASHQVTSLSAAPATPELPSPSLVPGRPPSLSTPCLSRTLDGEQSRAPPARLA